MDFEVLIPDGYTVVETDRVVDSENAHVYTHFLSSFAERHAVLLNEARLGPLYRYVTEPISKEMRVKLGRLSRWAVVPYQNVLRKIEE